MNYPNKIIFVLFVLLFILQTNFYSQSATPCIKRKCIFSTVAGSVSKPDSMLLPPAAVSFKLTGVDTSVFKIMDHRNKKIKIEFAPPVDFIGIAKAQLQIKNSSGKLIASIDFTGLSTKALEGGNEPPLSHIIDALGYQVNIGWASLDNHSRPELIGEELSPSLFRKAGNDKVQLIPVARYSPDFEVPFGYYINGEQGPQLQQTGVLAKSGAYIEHQTLFPAINSGTTSFDPRDNTFGFYATGPSHTGYSEDVWNMLLYPAYAVRATRIYPLKDQMGQQLRNTYLICFEEAKNGDYNDYVFIAKNITPVDNDLFHPLFNGKNLQGWDTFLRNIGSNADPNNNFMIANNELFVSGKDLGYVITKKGYRNFHFAVDFKWGNKKWPPRENDKRDAGICYNIPVNEPDSIWPQSIECQIQEGDTGDFWLLGFSTIKVNGIKNVPANHTRMVKHSDAEKPSGQWNTVEVISYNGKCVHIVNGVVVNAGEEASVKEGRILLQSEFSEIYYRNIRIREL